MNYKTLLKQQLTKLQYLGWAHYCSVCHNHLRSFLPFGDPPRQNALCPVCHSLERHRLDQIFFEKYTNLFDKSPKKMLHIAPEQSFELRLKQIENLDYISADLMSPRAMLKVDITDIPFPDNTFDIVYCSHVLEHVPDDKRAISEFHRVCKPQGWAVLQVPITTDKTFEDPSITSPEERKRVFGQEDHVRCCGPDYIDRIQAAGFKTNRLRATDVVKPTDCQYLGFQENRLVFYCEKAA
ncbi:class I SAM-dependent methyltransferase [Leptolyngbya sp. FACHB-261]|uniref:class I SAM-dependent methyltransferase n=1 Tax=Leptolyngbya sp. FACHB-261 TaxID=2692806 RepID=UPI0016820A95|nr:class I SAM-dependent methyltransferase [Leptolyngbya sp. FACHB-261]MBD2102837.1 methyltransferase domain-containing protein [Leptolyngbya sp. FACHB-261]